MDQALPTSPQGGLEEAQPGRQPGVYEAGPKEQIGWQSQLSDSEMGLRKNSKEFFRRNPQGPGAAAKVYVYPYTTTTGTRRTRDAKSCSR